MILQPLGCNWERLNSSGKSLFDHRWGTRWGSLWPQRVDGKVRLHGKIRLHSFPWCYSWFCTSQKPWEGETRSVNIQPHPLKELIKGLRGRRTPCPFKWEDWALASCWGNNYLLEHAHCLYRKWKSTGSRWPEKISRIGSNVELAHRLFLNLQSCICVASSFLSLSWGALQLSLRLET